MSFCLHRSAFCQDKSIDQITLSLGQGYVVIDVDVNPATIADMFATNPAISVQISIITYVMMLSLMIMIVVHHAV